MSDDAPTPEDAALFAELDSVVERLRRGEPLTAEDRRRLAGMAECLEGLEALAGAGEVEIEDCRLKIEDWKNETVPQPDHSGLSRSSIFNLQSSISSSLPAPSASPSGPSLGNYVLQDELGRGGMGVVFKAWQTDLRRTVAVKMILAGQLANRTQVEQFFDEARAAGRIRHPHVVGVHQYGEWNGQPYIAMDYVSGQSLAAAIAEGGPFAPEAAARMVATLARTVDYLHGEGILHRDLKPGNVLVDAAGQPHVTDFGLARAFREAEAERTGVVAGTPSYMPPEQARGRNKEVGVRSDVYSLGAILYAMLVGRPPFAAESQLSTILAVLEQEPERPRQLRPAIPRALEQICLRCLEKSPDRRYPTAAALADDLERYLRAEPVEAASQDLLTPFRRWVLREPALAAQLGAIAAFVAIIEGNYAIHFRDIDPVHNLKVVGCLIGAAVAAWGCQRLMKRPRWAAFARTAWLVVVAVFCTAGLLLAHGDIGPLLVAYPVLIVASGFLARARYVALMTVLSLVSAAVLQVCKVEFAQWNHYPLLFAAGLAIVGLMTALQVRRLRLLGRFYGRRTDASR